MGYLMDDLILSKQTGGEWGLEKLPDEDAAFAEYMMEKIEERM